MGMFFVAAMVASAATLVATEAARREGLSSLITARGWFPLAMALLMVVVARATARIGTAAGVREDGTPRAPRSSKVGPWIDVGLHLWVLNNGQFAAWAYYISGENAFLATLIAWIPWATASLVRADVERSLKAEHRGERWEGVIRRAAFALGARVRVLLLLPVLITAGIEWATTYFPEAEAISYSLGAGGQVLLTVINLLAVVGLSPFLVGWLMDIRPIEDKVLKGELEEDLRRQGIGGCPVGEINTGGSIPNAAYLGLGGASRRIVVTDALLRVLGPAEVRAVVAHETAHGTRHHIPTIMGLVVAMFGLGAAFAGDFFAFFEGVAMVVSQGNKDAAPTIAAGLMMIVTLAWTVFGVWWFGRMSRAFEVEADITAARSLGSGESLAKSLLALHAEFGGRIDKAGFRHPSILTRCRYLTDIAAQPNLERVLLAPARRHRLVVAGGILLALLGGARHLGEVLAIGPLRVDVIMGSRLEDATRLAKGADRARLLLGDDRYRTEANELGIAAVVGLIDIDLKVGRFELAKTRLTELEVAWPTGDALGDYNRTHMMALYSVAMVGGEAAFERVRLAEDARLELEQGLARRGMALDPISARETERELTIARSLTEPDASWPNDVHEDAPAWQKEAVARTRAWLARKENP